MNSPASSNSWNGRFVGDNERYRIDRPLAAGGMGEVLLATDTRVGQQVVLKLLKDTLVASYEMRKRFEREVAICAALQSDHIVKISDCGVTPEGYPFYVMEYLRGQTLRQLLLSEKRLSVERTASIISQVCQGLELAHQGVTLQKDGSSEHIQVVHRDLKPDNIFLVPTDLGEWVKILDFGVAKIRNESSDQTNFTQTFIGTFRYAAPEQIQNKKNLDARADIYSLGIILYEMLCAADPFGFSIQGNNISEASWVLAHTYEPPKLLREQPGCQHLSAEVEAVVIKCLQKNPNNRFASVAELNQALQIASKPATPKITRESTIVQPQPDSAEETISKPLQPLQPSQSEDETILRPQQVYNQGLNNETVPRPIQPVEPIQPLDNQGLNNDTVPRPIQPIEPDKQGRTIFQPRRSSDTVENNDTVPRTPQPIPPQPEGRTIFQPRRSSDTVENNDTVPRTPQPIPPQPEGRTIFQPRRSSDTVDNNDTVPRTPQPIPPQPVEGTIFQPRRSSATTGNNDTVPPTPQPIPPHPPEERRVQHNPSPYPPSQRPIPPEEPDRTIFQPHRSSATGGNKDTVSPPQQSIPPNPANGEPKNTNLFWRNLAIGLAIVLGFLAGMYIFSQMENGSRQSPDPTQSQQ